MAEATQNGWIGHPVGKIADNFSEGILRAGIKISDDLREQFDDLTVDDVTLRAKYINFCHAIHEEQREIVIRSRAVWAQAKLTLGLQGNWRYEDGRVYPVDETATK